MKANLSIMSITFVILAGMFVTGAIACNRYVKGETGKYRMELIRTAASLLMGVTVLSSLAGACVSTDQTANQWKEVPARPELTPPAAHINIAFDVEVEEDFASYMGEFSPFTITVAPGTNVTWKNTDNKEHAVISDDGLFDETLLSGGSFTFAFDKPGNFTYRCGLYDFEMAGKVIVEE